MSLQIPELNYEKGKSRNNSVSPSISPRSSCSHDLKIRPSQFVQKQFGEFSVRYEKGDLIGRGSWGEVFKIINKDDRQLRAMKIIPKQKIKEAQLERNDLLREVDLQKNLDHPNILKVYEYFEDAMNFYIVTEFVNGKELFEEIISRDSFTEEQAA